MERSQQTVVFSHGPCPDGWGAAWSFWRTLPESVRLGLASHGGYYSKTPGPKVIDGPEVTSAETAAKILDAGSPVAFVFTYPTAVIDKELVRDRRVLIFDLALEISLDNICQVAHSVLVLDHHKSGKETALLVSDKYKSTGIVEVFYDMNRSAAKIVWDRFHPGQTSELVEYIQDRDIWTWKLPNSREISEAFYTGSYFDNFWEIEAAHQKWKANKEAMEAELVALGSGAIKYQRRLLEELAGKAVPATMEATVDGVKSIYNVLLSNSPTLASDLGNYMMESLAPQYEQAVGFKAHLAAIWSYRMKEDKIYCSLRTNRKDVDLSKIARAIEGGLPGGGHAAAGAFTLEGSSISKCFKLWTKPTQ